MLELSVPPLRNVPQPEASAQRKSRTVDSICSRRAVHARGFVAAQVGRVGGVPVAADTLAPVLEPPLRRRGQLEDAFDRRGRCRDIGEVEELVDGRQGDLPLDQTRAQDQPQIRGEQPTAGHTGVEDRRSTERIRPRHRLAFAEVPQDMAVASELHIERTISAPEPVVEQLDTGRRAAGQRPALARRAADRHAAGLAGAHFDVSAHPQAGARRHRHPPSLSCAGDWRPQALVGQPIDAGLGARGAYPENEVCESACHGRR